MRVRPKVTCSTEDLALYALAQVRAQEVERSCASSCEDCPGPGVEGGCETRTNWPRAVAGRADWTFCPLGMIRAPAWREIVDEYSGTRIFNSDPDELSAYAYRGVMELHDAVRREDERRQKESSGGGPVFTGNRVARVEE